VRIRWRGFIAQQRNMSWSWDGHRQDASGDAIARSCIRAGSAAGSSTPSIWSTARSERRTLTGSLADYLTRLGLLIFDELGYLPFAQAGGQPSVPSDKPPLRADLVIVTTNLAFGEGSVSAIRDDHALPIVLSIHLRYRETGNDSWRFKTRMIPLQNDRDFRDVTLRVEIMPANR